MKKYICFFFVILFNSFLFAQNQNNYPIDRMQYASQNVPIFITVKKDIEKVILKKTSMYGAVTNYERIYDLNGRLLTSKKSSKGGDLLPLYTFKYTDTLKQPSEVTTYKKNGEISTVTSYVRNKNGEMTEYCLTDSKNKILEKSVWIYKDSVRLDKSIKFKKGGEKIESIWLYEYNDDGWMLKTSLLDSNNKVKYVWTYDCNEEGTILQKEKDKTQVCNWHKSDDNFYIFVHQTFDENGKIRKYVSKYAVADSSIVETTTYNEKGELIYRKNYDGNINKVTTYEHFKNGKTNWKRINTFDGDLITNSKYSNKNGFSSKSEYIYDEDDRMIEYVCFDKKDRRTEKIEIQYFSQN